MVIVKCAAANNRAMYAGTVAKRPARIVTRTRPGPSHRPEPTEPIRDLTPRDLTPRDLTRKSSPETSPASSPDMHSPRPSFTQRKHSRHRPEPALSPQHQEAIRYLAYTWRRVKDECENTRNSGTDITSLYYREPDGQPVLLDFQPFDLEAWWARRLYQHLTGATS